MSLLSALSWPDVYPRITLDGTFYVPYSRTNHSRDYSATDGKTCFRILQTRQDGVAKDFACGVRRSRERGNSSLRGMRLAVNVDRDHNKRAHHLGVL